MRTLECSVLGYCSAKDGKCVAGKDADCRNSKQCKDKGLCVASWGKCFKTKTARPIGAAPR